MKHPLITTIEAVVMDGAVGLVCCLVVKSRPVNLSHNPFYLFLLFDLMIQRSPSMRCWWPNLVFKDFTSWPSSV